jgi:hypothetical protein
LATLAHYSSTLLINNNTGALIKELMMNSRSEHISKFNMRHLLLVCLLSLSTLWINSASAAHIHLDDHEHQGELCLSSHSSATALETNVSKLTYTATTSEVAVGLTEKPQLIPVAPCNSRAPPFQL